MSHEDLQMCDSCGYFKLIVKIGSASYSACLLHNAPTNKKVHCSRWISKEEYKLANKSW